MNRHQSYYDPHSTIADVVYDCEAWAIGRVKLINDAARIQIDRLIDRVNVAGGFDENNAEVAAKVK